MVCLLVEDERQAREGMAALVPWSELGFERVLTASNGLEALDMLKSESPDLIISDVRMPRMSGVQLLKALRDAGREIPFLFISGFSDKEYLMAAIRYHAVDYLEKPVMLPELTERLRAIAAGMHAARRMATPRSLLEEGAPPPELLQGAKRLWVAILALSEDGLRLTAQQVSAAMRGLGRRTLQQEETPERTLLIVAEKDEPVDFSGPIEALNRAGGGYALCVSEPVADFAALPAAYAQADACASRAYMGPLRGLQIYASAEETVAGLARRAKEEMRALIDRRMYSLLPERAEACARALRGVPEAGRADALALFRALSQPFGQPDWKALAEEPDLRRAVIALRGRIEAWADAALEGGTNAAVGRAIRYIAANIDGLLSVSELSRAAFISSSHLSYLLKQETGLSVKQYITEFRLQKARLLLEEGRSVHEVAAAVGIRDVLYFSKLFKRETGRTPSEYR